jgi:hypothetical protein
MAKTGFGNWKGPFKEAVKGEDYIDPCPSGTYLVRGYKRPDGVEVPAYCRKENEKSGYSAEIRKAKVIVIPNTPNPKIRHEKGYYVTGFNPDGISLSEDYFSTKKEAEKHKRMIEKGEYY